MFPYSNEEMCEAYRAAIRSMAEMMSASLAGFERLQNCQLNATQQTLSAQAESVDRLEAATDVHELIEIGTQLGWLQLDQFLSCWNSLSASIGMNQMEFMRHAQIRSLEAMNGMERMLEDVPLALGTEQVASALKVAVDTTRSSYAAGVRVMNQAEREAAARLESTHEHRREEPTREKTRRRKARATA